MELGHHAQAREVDSNVIQWAQLHYFWPERRDFLNCSRIEQSERVFTGQYCYYGSHFQQPS